MKLTTLTLLLIITFSKSFSQTFYKIISTSYREYENGKFVVKSTSYPKDMFVISDGDQFKVTRDEKEVYQCYGEPIKTNASDHYTISRKAYDKDGKKCDVVLTGYKGENVIYVTIFYLQAQCALEYKVKAS